MTTWLLLAAVLVVGIAVVYGWLRFHRTVITPAVERAVERMVRVRELEDGPTDRRDG